MGHRLSIIIPTYNCKQYLDECINSVILTMGASVELILVDDGSDDGTADKLRSYSNTENLKIVFCDHKGASSARNSGLDAATGDYVAFVDCDDCLKDGFLEESMELMDKGADLYIFGIERIHLEGNSEYWTVTDKFYPSISDFADEYVRVRQLMIYSNCNKFYRRSIIEDNNIRFNETIVFGEDRLFNYAFLMHCGSVLTSSMIMLRYIQRNGVSMSTKYVPDFFRNVMFLHDEKIKCILSLSKGTTDAERNDFIAYDLAREVELAVGRFKDHPREREENLPLINDIIFGTSDEFVDVDILLVLGSSNCEYKARRAAEIGSGMKGVKYIVTGGNPHISGVGTEAECMASYLRDCGVNDSDIYLENRAKNTRQNFDFSSGIIRALCGKRDLKDLKIGVVTGGFHVPRTRIIAGNTPSVCNLNLYYYPAYGPNTAPDNWYKNTTGFSIILNELRKTEIMRNEQRT